MHYYLVRRRAGVVLYGPVCLFSSFFTFLVCLFILYECNCFYIYILKSLKRMPNNEQIMLSTTKNYVAYEDGETVDDLNG